MRELEREAPETAGVAADATPLPRLAIVGRGRVGTALATAAERAGLDVVMAGRDDLAQVVPSAGAALLCVPDEAIPGACEKLVATATELRLVGHVSGATGLDALGAAAERGCDTFSLHPLQTVPETGADLTGAPCAVAGASPASLEFATALTERVGMRPFEVHESSRAAYHAAASIASNFLVTLEESAARLMGAAGVTGARELLAPLVLRTAANWSEQGPEALTGPIARGDEATIARHLEALAERAPELLPLYEALAERTRALKGAS